jgi:phospholipid transport system transporter-binding protein
VTAPEVLRADGSGRFRIEGDLTIESAPAVLQASAGLLSACGASEVEIDLAGLRAFDSAALGVFFEWRRCAAPAGGRIRYINLPPKLATMAQLYGVDALLAVQVAPATPTPAAPVPGNG